VTILARPASGKTVLRVRAETSDGLPLAGVNVAIVLPSYRHRRGAVTIDAIDARMEEQLASFDTFDSSRGTATTDAAGRCQFADVPDRRLCVNVATRYGEVSRWESAGWIKPWQVFARPGADDVVLVFRRGRAIRGRVELPDGAPRPAAPGGKPRTMVIVQEAEGALVSTTWCDEDGRFTAWAPADSPGPFRVSAGGWVTADERVFQAETLTVSAAAEDVVLKIVEAKR
jgi:hypothetical protein